MTSQKNIKLMIQYFDTYPLQSRKYLQFFILRRTYRLMLRKEHYTLQGLNKVYNFKKI